MEIKDKATALRILVLDFNRSACLQARSFKEYLQGHENLFALSRLYYVTFARQDKLAWADFLATAVLPLIRSGCYVSLKQLMIQKIKDITKEGRCAILVDEILKTSAIGSNFSNLLRSHVCKWVDSNGICDVVLFSTLDLDFITKERSISGRIISAVTTLPLLQQSDSVALLRASIKVNFIKKDGIEIGEIAVFNQLALASGGHPRPLEYIIGGCNGCKGSLSSLKFKIDITKIIRNAARKLSDSCVNTKNWKELFYIIMLGKEVNRNDKIGHEKFTDLVSRGVLIRSFDESSATFIPTVPQLFLHKWLVKQGDDVLSNEIRGYLDDILRMRSNFTGRMKFKIMHFSWENLMRHVRQREPLIYKNIRLNDLYCNNLRYDATFASSRCVDGYTLLREINM